jgi:hypothetical protein
MNLHFLLSHWSARDYIITVRRAVIIITIIIIIIIIITAVLPYIIVSYSSGCSGNGGIIIICHFITIKYIRWLSFFILGGSWRGGLAIWGSDGFYHVGALPSKFTQSFPHG